MAVRKVLNYIDAISENLENNDSEKSPSVKNMLGILSTIRIFVENSNDGEHTEELEAALKYIETVPTAGFFPGSTTTVGARLSDKNPVLLKKPQANKDIGKISDEYQAILGTIHISLMQLYQLELQQKEKIVWEHSYDYKQPEKKMENKATLALSSKEDQVSVAAEKKEVLEEEILTDALGGWQNDMMELSKPGSALRDINRGVGIPGKLPSQKTITQERLNQIIKKLLEKTTYSEEDKPLIEEWIDANLSQLLWRFTDDMIAEGDFTNKDDNFGWGFQEVLDQCLYVENGKFCFEYEVLLKSAKQGAASILYMDPEAHQRGEKNKYVYWKETPNMKIDEKAFAEVEKLEKILKSEKTLPPIARIRGRGTLEVDREKKLVKPILKDLKVTSYNSFLRNPLEKYHSEKKKSSQEKTYNLKK